MGKRKRERERNKRRENIASTANDTVNEYTGIVDGEIGTLRIVDSWRRLKSAIAFYFGYQTTIRSFLSVPRADHAERLARTMAIFAEKHLMLAIIRAKCRKVETEKAKRGKFEGNRVRKARRDRIGQERSFPNGVSVSRRCFLGNSHAREFRFVDAYSMTGNLLDRPNVTILSGAVIPSSHVCAAHVTNRPQKVANKSYV